MRSPGSYASARSFRNALEARLKQIASDEETDLHRLRRQVAFDRVLARLFSNPESPWLLKGGYAMELRMHRARSTRDIDLTIDALENIPGQGDPVNLRIRKALQEQIAAGPEDYFTFLIGEPTRDIESAPYGGARYPVDARLDGRTFVKFHIDVGLGDIVPDHTEIVETRDWLGFAKLPPPAVRLLPREQQFAEKLHAFTLPDRQGSNSRVKDLVDMVMLIQRGDMAVERVKESIASTFGRRKTHALQYPLSPPPESWRPVYEHLAAGCGLDGSTDAAFAVLCAYLENL